MCGCAVSVKPTPGANPLASIQQVTDADLKAAIVIAQASTPPDAEGVACFTFLDSNLAGLSSSPPAVTGAISAFELAHVVTNTVNGLSPVQNVALEQACGPYALNVIGGLAGLMKQLGVTAGITVKP